MKKILKHLVLMAVVLSPALATPRGQIQDSNVKSIFDIESALSFTLNPSGITGNLVNGSACIASPSSTSGLLAGAYAYDTTNPSYVPAGTQIVGIGTSPCSSGQIKLSATALSNATGDTFIFGGQPSQAINSSKIWLETLVPQQTLAQAVTSGSIGGSGGPGGKNYLANPSFQGGVTGWTVTNGAPSVDLTTHTDGSQSLKITLSGGADGSIYQDVTPTDDLSGINLGAILWTKTLLPGMSICSRVNGVEVQCNPVSATGSWEYQAPNMGGPVAGTSIGVSLKWPSGLTGTVNLNSGYVGKATNLSQVSQATILGSATTPGGTASCLWSQSASQGVFTGFSAATSCPVATVTGSAQAPVTKIPAIVFPSMGPGQYVVHATGHFGYLQAGGRCTFGISDGTNNYPGGSIGIDNVAADAQMPGFTTQFNYSTAQSNVTLQMVAAGIDGASTCATDQTFTGTDFKIWVEYFPSQSQLAMTPNTTPASATLGFYGTTFYWSNTSGTSGPTDFSLTSGTPSAGFNVFSSTNMGSCTSTPSDAYPGFQCNGFGIGNKYRICGFFAGYHGGTNSAGGVGLWDGTTVFTPYTNIGTASTFSTYPATCGDYVATTTNPIIRFAARGTNEGSQFACDTPFNCYINFTIEQITGAMPAPILVGSVASSSLGAEKLERLSFTPGGSPIINSQSGSWVSSITRNGAGDYTINISSGEFSAAPTCQCTVGNNGTGATVCQGRDDLTAFSPTIIRFQTTYVGVVSDVLKEYISCQGPR